MAKYLAKASYTAEGTQGLLKDGGSARLAAVTKAVKKLGGKVDAFYFAYGAADVIVIVDMPDETSAVALSLAINAAGAVRLEMVQLISVKQMDEAAKITVGYRAPGE